MSTPIQHEALDPKSLQYYAPRRLRGGVSDAPSIQPLPDADRLPDPQTFDERRPPYDDASPAGAAIGGEYKSRPVRLRRKRTIAILASIAAAASIAVAILFLDTTKFADWRKWARATKDAEMSFAERLQAEFTAFNQVSQKAVAPTLSVADGSGDINARLPLGVEVTNYSPGATVNLSGLLAGSVLSTGSESAEGQWRVAVDDLPTTRVSPPRDYVGPMTIVAELRDGNGHAIIRSPVKYTWRQAAADSAKAAAPQPPAANAAAANGGQAVVTPRQIDPKEVAALLKRAEDLVSNGDLPAARLLLHRLAEAHNARAAFALGATYDPIVINQLGSVSTAADLTMARSWYQKAQDWGSSDASKHLAALASMAQ